MAFSLRWLWRLFKKKGNRYWRVGVAYFAELDSTTKAKLERWSASKNMTLRRHANKDNRLVKSISIQYLRNVR